MCPRGLHLCYFFLDEYDIGYTNFTKVTRMVFFEVNSMVMLTTSISATPRMLSMLANAAVAMANMSAHLSVNLAC